MLIKHQKDFWAGILFIAFGLAAVAIARENALGTLSRMGPAYFPTMLGWILAGLGAVLSLRAVLARGGTPGSEIEPVNWRVLLFVLGSVALFAVTLLACGLVIALAVMIAAASIANPRWRAREILVLILVLCTVCLAVFVWGIGMQVPVLPAFLTGRV